MNDYTKALHQRFYQKPENTEEEQEKVNNHYPAALSFSTTPKQEL